MEESYLGRLPPDLRNLVTEIETAADFPVTVEVDVSRAGRYSNEPDPFACVVNETEARILIPSPDDFRPGSVLHELLHFRRFLVHRVPQLSVCDDHCTPELEEALSALDNNIEHLLIVPEEIRWFPDRVARWVSVMHRILSQVESGALPSGLRDSLAVYASLFIEHALPEKGIRTRSRAIAAELGVADRAAHLRASVIPVLGDKVATTAIFVEHFGIANEYVCLDYLDPRNRAVEQRRLA